MGTQKLNKGGCPITTPFLTLIWSPSLAGQEADADAAALGVQKSEIFHTCRLLHENSGQFVFSSSTSSSRAAFAFHFSSKVCFFTNRSELLIEYYHKKNILDLIIQVGHVFLSFLQFWCKINQPVEGVVTGDRVPEIGFRLPGISGKMGF